MGIYSTFQGAFALPLHDRSGWTAPGRQRDRDRCARSDRVCVGLLQRQPGTLTPIHLPTHQESLGKGQNPPSKMPRSFLVKKHFNSSKKPNYSELDTHTGSKMKLCATALLLRLRSLRGSSEEGWDCFLGSGEWVSSLLALFPFAYKEGALRNVSALPRMNSRICSST